MSTALYASVIICSARLRNYKYRIGISVQVKAFGIYNHHGTCTARQLKVINCIYSFIKGENCRFNLKTKLFEAAIGIVFICFGNLREFHYLMILIAIDKLPVFIIKDLAVLRSRFKHESDSVIIETSCAAVTHLTVLVSSERNLLFCTVLVA